MHIPHVDNNTLNLKIQNTNREAGVGGGDEGVEREKDGGGKGDVG